MAITGGRFRRREGPRRVVRSLAPWVALSGTPGAGKSSVLARLPRRLRPRELAREARKRHAASGRGRKISVDLRALENALRTDPNGGVLGGHLAHLLPLRDVVVLRCRPDRLEARLTKARRGSPASRRENAEAEATDLVLLEALDLGRNVYEIDTTRRTPGSVAREVTSWLDGPRRPRFGTVDWLADPRVAAHLLRAVR